MIKATLQPLDGGQKPIEIPKGKTVIGRGPLLGCNDKKVSRNHAVLEVTETGEVFLTPIHVNPCFYQANSESQPKTLKKEKAQKLSPGDIFSLLPASFRYKVLLGKEDSDGVGDEDKGKENSRDETLQCITTKPVDVNQSSSNENEIKFSEGNIQNNNKDVPVHISRTADAVKQETKETENEHDIAETKGPQEQNEDAKSTREDGMNHNDAFKDDGEDKKQMRNEDKPPLENNKADAKRVEIDAKDDDDDEPEDDDDDLEEDDDKETNNKSTFPNYEQEVKTSKEEQRIEKSVASILTPVRKKRTLPLWLLQLSESPNKRQQQPQQLKEEEEMIDEPVKTPKRRGKGSRQAAASTSTATSYQPKTTSRSRRTYRDDAEDSIAKARCSRQNRQTRQRLSLDDFIVSDDDDWASDASGKRKTKGRRKRKKSDDSGSDWEVEHKKKRRYRRQETDSDSASDWEAEKRKKKTPTKGRGRRKRKVAASEDEEELNEPSGSQEVKKKREACVYGKRCYRRNPVHFQEYSHPGDSDYMTDVEPDPPDANDERPECPYGVECYRKNAEHRKEFKHTKKIRPKREAAKKAADKKREASGDDDDDDEDDDDEGGANNNLNDSFMNDDDDSDEFQPGAESGSDWNPGNDSEGDDLKGVAKTSKGLVHSKRTQKKV